MLKKIYQHQYFFPRIFTWMVLFLPIFIVVRVFVLAYWAAETDFETICKNISHPPRQAVFLLTTEGDTLGAIDKGTEVTYSQLPKALVETLILEEDSTFWKNNGINFPDISLIAQSSLSLKVARNVAYNMGRKRGRLIFYIARYLWLPLMLERNFTKTEILTLFCNEISWDWNNRGIDKACANVFHKKVENLHLQEIALLVTIEKRPDARTDTSKALIIRNRILANMAKYDIYPKKWKDSLQQSPLIFFTDERENGMRKYLINTIKQDIEKYQNIYYQGNTYENGFTIQTTISSKMQELAEINTTEMMAKIQRDFEKGNKSKIPKDTAKIIEMMKGSDYWQQRIKWGSPEKNIEKDIFEKEKTTIFTWQGEKDSLMSPYEVYVYEKMFRKIGFCVLSPQTGHILAYIGGANQHFFKRDNLYCPYLLNTINKRLFTACVMENGKNPVDFSREAMEKRHNFSQSIGIILPPQIAQNELITFYRTLGFEHSLPIISDCFQRGAFDASLYELMGAYSVLANQGKYTQPILIQSIIDKNGNKTDLIPATWQAISPSISAKIMRDLENETMQDYGTGFEFVAKYGLKGQFACQEAHLSENEAKWFIAIQGDLIVGTWVGEVSPYYQWNDKAYYEVGENVVGNYLRLLPNKKVKGM